MIKFFYDSLETLQKVKFATKKDYISLGIGVVVSIIVCGAFFIGVDTLLSGGYKTFYSLMRSPSLESQLSADSAGSGDIILSTGSVSSGTTMTGSVSSSGITVSTGS